MRARHAQTTARGRNALPYALHEAAFPSPDAWDRMLLAVPGWHLYQTSAWLDFVEHTQPARRRLFELRDADGRLVAFLPGLEVRRGPFRLFGSPLPGWTTPYIGPVALDAGAEMADLLRSAAAALRRHGVQHAELVHPSLEPGAVAEAPGLVTTLEGTYVGDIAATPEDVLASYSKSTRRSVRKAQRQGLVAEFATDPSFVDEYYEQLRMVFGRRGLVPTYPVERVRALWDVLMPTGRMLATRVSLHGDCVATRIDLVGNRWLHSFGSASRPDCLKLSPNELARFHAMAEAARRGLTRYDMTGGGSYKSQFNAHYVQRPRLLVSSPFVLLIRSALRRLHASRLRWRGGGVRSRAAEPADD